jgi:small subunit ribosomal protein S6
LRNYEIMLIVRPEADDEAFKATADKVSGWITAEGGEVIKTDLWGRRRMAYSIKGIREGLYAVIAFKSEPKTLVPLEHNIKLAEEVVRYLIVVLET